MTSVQPMLKRLLHRYLPGLAGEIHAFRDRQQIQRVEQRLGLKDISHQFMERYGLTVLAGPFKGMSYVPDSVGSTYIPKLLGSYELELHRIISEIAAEDFRAVIDIGCAEGYYAVGLARLIPTTEVFAFDTAFDARRLCVAMAKANGVSSHVHVRGACRPMILDDLVKPGSTLILCDCEGYEYQLLRPDLTPSLVSSVVLVELHPWQAPDCSEYFLDIWKKTHDIKLIASVPRNPSDFPHLTLFGAEQQKNAVDELRVEDQMWAYMRPRSL